MYGELLDDMQGGPDRSQRTAPPLYDPFLEGNDTIEETITQFRTKSTKENLAAVLDAVRIRMHADGHFLIPVIRSEDGREFIFRTLETGDGQSWFAAFTSPAEFRKGEFSQILSYFIDSTLQTCLRADCAGLILNPWDQAFLLPKDLIRMLFEADTDNTDNKEGDHHE